MTSRADRLPTRAEQLDHLDEQDHLEPIAWGAALAVGDVLRQHVVDLGGAAYVLQLPLNSTLARLRGDVLIDAGDLGALDHIVSPVEIVRRACEIAQVEA